METVRFASHERIELFYPKFFSSCWNTEKLFSCTVLFFCKRVELIKCQCLTGIITITPSIPKSFGLEGLSSLSTLSLSVARSGMLTFSYL